MNAKDVKHGMHVTTDCAQVWEVLDRKATGVWWLHRWDGGEWFTTYAHVREMTLVNNGARQMELIAS